MGSHLERRWKMTVEFCACWAEPDIYDHLTSALRLGLLQFPFCLAWAYARFRPFVRWEETRLPWQHIRSHRAGLGRPLLTPRAGSA